MAMLLTPSKSFASSGCSTPMHWVLLLLIVSLMVVPEALAFHTPLAGRNSPQTRSHFPTQSQEAVGTKSTNFPVAVFNNRRKLSLNAGVTESLDILLFDIENWASQLVNTELTHITPLSLGVLYLGGLLTSFSPCALSMLPLTISYLGE
ncbi:unnamed protein product [Heterosigma akashiwo]